MKGLEAIIYHDGFSMAAVGVSIVFTALVALSLIISQLHRALILWDNRRQLVQRMRALFSEPQKEEPPPLSEDLQHINEEARQFNILIQALGEPFSLPRLIRVAETFGVAHPHAAAGHLISRNLIIPDHKGYFRWNHEAYHQLVKRSRY
jgi:hypothetical protein